MKRFVGLFILSLCLTSGLLFGQEERIWNIVPTSSHWARETGSLEISLDESVKYEGKPCVKAIHKGRQDWNFTYSKAMKVTPGEVYEITCPVRVEGSGNMGNSSIIQSGKNIIMYGYARTETSDTGGQWKELKSTFVIPRNITSLCPRMSGSGEATVWFGPHKLRKLPPRTLLDETKTWSIENERLKVTLSAKDASFAVLDKKTGRLWNQLVDAGLFFPSKVDATTNELKIEAFDAATLQDYRFGLRLDALTNEVVATVDAVDRNAPMKELCWPYPFVSKEGDWLIVPLTQGFNFPVTDKGPYGKWNGYSSLSMPFCSHVEDTSGAGYVAILETPDDAGVRVLASPLEANAPANSPALLIIRPVWDAQRRTFGYARSIRYSFFDQGRHVAACKRYRRHAQETGLHVTFEEKARRNPALADGLARLKGAANIWYFGRSKLIIFHDMLELGMDHLLWSGGGNGDEIAEMNRAPHVLTGRYDIYQDLVDPALHSQLGGIPGSHLKGAWPKDIMWKDPDGTPTKGWHAPNKDPKKPRIPCDVLCDTKALDYANRTIPKDLAEVPYTARFIDTTTSTPWRECWNPDHPMTRTDSRIWKMKLLELMGKKYHLVCGSETGRDASVPYCDYYEGMMSMGWYIIPSDSKTLEHFNDDPPANVIKYGVGENYRLPLWELVYHDCTVAYNWWYDFNNARAKIWKKRDLFNVLYATPPIYRFEDKFWSAHKHEIAASYHVAQKTSLIAGGVEMLDHRFLTKDHKVQQTTFANGVIVTVNFGDKPWQGLDGTTLAPMSSVYTEKTSR